MILNKGICYRCGEKDKKLYKGMCENCCKSCYSNNQKLMEEVFANQDDN